MPTTTMPTVVLVHGIWMNGWEMGLLRLRLKQAGFNVVQFTYRSVSQNLPCNAQHLQTFVNGINASEIHIVAHSLGGLLVRQFFHDFPRQKPGRIVTLGSPHGGSFVAGKLNRTFLGRVLVGKSLQQGMLGAVPAWTSDHEIGVIAGDRGPGIGAVISRLPKPNDGTVVLAETSLPGMTDYKIMPTNHIGLLFAKSVAQQVIHFLLHGVFSKDL